VRANQSCSLLQVESTPRVVASHRQATAIQHRITPADDPERRGSLFRFNLSRNQRQSWQTSRISPSRSSSKSRRSARFAMLLPFAGPVDCSTTRAMTFSCLSGVSSIRCRSAWNSSIVDVDCPRLLTTIFQTNNPASKPVRDKEALRKLIASKLTSTTSDETKMVWNRLAAGASQLHILLDELEELLVSYESVPWEDTVRRRHPVEISRAGQNIIGLLSTWTVLCGML